MIKNYKSGSETFGTTNIKTDEYVLMAQVMKENGSTVQEIALDIECMDELLSIQKAQLIIAGQMRTKTGKLRKNSSMLDIMDGRLDQLVNEHRQLKNRKDNE